MCIVGHLSRVTGIVSALLKSVVCVRGCSWNRLTGGAPLTERTRLNVREFTLNPLVQKVSSTMGHLIKWIESGVNSGVIFFNQ